MWELNAPRGNLPEEQYERAGEVSSAGTQRAAGAAQTGEVLFRSVFPSHLFSIKNYL